MTIEEQQKYRCRVPEPSRVDWPIVRFRLDTVTVSFLDAMPEEVGFTPLPIGEFQRILCEDGCGTQFWAWSYDGITPVFPVPIWTS